ncbi:Hypothetical Protein FCC1311_080982 [Hondaea fermentalgiana]|uniref:Transmembrane protein n=1 Tax=Hondaea fermentalgiana TaxID=2315210 RepID=A0A2R5GT93_9STRA|nr:Hypothetical Protein FCC1311_080982 [Hondaea fermentalgiana]|eukprot:GBG31873.1 Hypothetical Protein FCC1311_080982 [Hondaea fermentalgiana]
MEFRMVYMLVLWTLIGVLTLVFVLSSYKTEIVVAKDCEEDAKELAQVCPTSQRTISFSVLWQVFMVSLLTVGGIHMLRRHRNQTMVGFFIGVSFAMANWMLCKSVVFGWYVLSQEGLISAPQVKDARELSSGFRLYSRLAALSSVLLTVAYSVFALLLISFRQTITLGKSTHDVEREEEELDAPSRRTSASGSIISLVSPSSFSTSPASSPAHMQGSSSPSTAKSNASAAAVVSLDQV